MSRRMLVAEILKDRGTGNGGGAHRVAPLSSFFRFNAANDNRLPKASWLKLAAFLSAAGIAGWLMWWLQSGSLGIK